MAGLGPRRLAPELLRWATPRPRARCAFRAQDLRSIHSSTRRLLQPEGPRLKSGPSSSPKSQNGGSHKRGRRTATLAALAGGTLVSTSLFALSMPTSGSQDTEETSTSAADPPKGSTDDRDPSLPRFRLADVRKHDSSSEHPWVTHEDKVYDITNWVGAHPGGDVILRAAGRSIDPYWDIFKIHQAPYVREILAQYMIGYIDVADLVDGRPAAEDIEDPFESDPIRDPRLITHTVKPRNAETPRQGLVDEFITPKELFYVRNHMWVPVVDEATADEEHTLTIELPDGEERVYTLGELRRRFPMHRVTAAMQCSGNRRSDMTRHKRTNGLQWGAGAISNAVWEGVRLSDVLADAGLRTRDPTLVTEQKGQAAKEEEPLPDPSELHVQFSGLEAYGASIPLPAALDPRGDVLLALRMNGEPIPRDHGFPLRAVVPGHVAARSVKWLSKIHVSDEESPKQWQRRDYKCFGPNVGANPDWDSAPAIQEMPVTSAITGVWVGECVRSSRMPWTGGNGAATVQYPPADEKLPDTKHGREVKRSTMEEPYAAEGYAYSGGGREIIRVDISADGGKTWDQAELLDDSVHTVGNRAWSWKRWRYTGRLPLPAPTPTPEQRRKEGGKVGDEQARTCADLVVKATDSAYNTQPEESAGIYNVRGNLTTAWHRVRVCPTCTTAAPGPGGRPGGTVWSTGEDIYGAGFKKMPPEPASDTKPSASG